MAATTGAYFEGISLTTTDQTPIDPTDADAVIIYSSDDGIIWTYVTDSDINPSVVWDPDIPDFLGGAGPASRNYQYNEFPDNQYIKLEIVPGGCGGDCSGIDGYDFYYPDEGTEFDWSSLGFMNPDSPTGNDLGSFTGNSYFKETFVVVYGCTDEAACNTCDNGCNTDDGTCEYEDDCGVCYGGNEDMDCTGVCFGDAAIDCAGDCCVNYNETPTYEWSDECVEEDILEPIYNTSCINYIWEYIGENAIEVRFTITNSDGVLIYDSHQLNGATSQTYNGPSLYVDGIEYNGWGYDLVPYDQEDTSNDNMHYRNKGLWGSICLPNGTYTVRTFDYDVYSDSSSRMMWTNLKM